MVLAVEGKADRSSSEEPTQASFLSASATPAVFDYIRFCITSQLCLFAPGFNGSATASWTAWSRIERGHRLESEQFLQGILSLRARNVGPQFCEFSTSRRAMKDECKF